MIDSEASLTISALERVPRRKEHLLRLSDGTELRVTDEDLARFSLAPGLSLSADTVDRLGRAYEYSAAKQAALRLVKVRPRTEGELRRGLRSRAFSDAAVAGIIGDLKAAGIVDDRVFARLWVAERVRKGAGRRRILAELKTKMVDEAAARAEIDAQYGPEDEMANATETALARLARLQSLPLEKRNRRVYDYLMRQGFDSDVARAAMRSAGGARDQKGEQ